MTVIGFSNAVKIAFTGTPLLTERHKQTTYERFGTMTAYLESKDRIKKIAEDIIEHYTQEVLPNGLKAQVVATSIVAACRYKYELEDAIRGRIDKELSKPASERHEELLKQMRLLKVYAVVTMSDNNELGYITRARRDAADMDAIESFKKDFNYDKP